MVAMNREVVIRRTLQAPAGLIMLTAVEPKEARDHLLCYRRPQSSCQITFTIAFAFHPSDNVSDFSKYV
jgi:hypothetical protein